MLIAAIHRDWCEAQGSYDESRFFTGLHPSEQNALRVTDCDLVQGKISSRKLASWRVTRTGQRQARIALVELCPRALQVLKPQLALWAEPKLQGANRSRRPLLQGRRCADPQSPVPPVEADATADEGPLPGTVQGPPLVRELEPDGRQDPIMGRK